MSELLPFLPNRVWRTYQGGAVLDRLEGRPTPHDSHFPEDWIGSTTVAVNPGERPSDEGLARIDGPGQPIFRDLLAADGGKLLGHSHVSRHGADPRLLVKFLDSSIRLHFQAHPTATFARKHGLGTSGKAEAYHILAIRPEISDPYIYLGFQSPPSKAEFKRMIEAQDIASLEACFEKIPVQVGETYFIPGGRPHAIGPGILMVEVMEPSDLAVRFEFERGGYVLPESARFMGRGLDFCLEVFDYRPLPVSETLARFRCEPFEAQNWNGAGTQQSLLEADRNPCFSLRKSSFTGPSRRRGGEAFFGVVTQGSGVLKPTNGPTLQVNQFDRFFHPYGIQALEVAPHGPEPLEILECFPPAP